MRLGLKEGASKDAGWRTETWYEAWRIPGRVGTWQWSPLPIKGAFCRSGSYALKVIWLIPGGLHCALWVVACDEILAENWVINFDLSGEVSRGRSTLNDPREGPNGIVRVYGYISNEFIAADQLKDLLRDIILKARLSYISDGRDRHRVTFFQIDIEDSNCRTAVCEIRLYGGVGGGGSRGLLLSWLGTKNENGKNIFFNDNVNIVSIDRMWLH